MSPKAESVLGVDASVAKLSERLGVQVDAVVQEQAQELERKLTATRERASLRELGSANAKAAAVLGHDAQREKLKRLLAIDDEQVASELDLHRREVLEAVVTSPACPKQSKTIVNAPSKAQKLCGFVPREASLAKVGHLLDLDQASVADAQADMVLVHKPAMKDVLVAPEKAQRLVGFVPDDAHADKIKERLGLTDHEFASAQKLLHKQRLARDSGSGWWWWLIPTLLAVALAAWAGTMYSSSSSSSSTEQQQQG